MSEASEYCCNCNPRVAFGRALFPYLCTKCERDPYRINLLTVTTSLLRCGEVRHSPGDEFPIALEYICDLKRKCDTNPVPVIIGIVLTELYPTGGKVLMVQRAIEPEIGGWALVSGFMVDQYSWQGNLRKEVIEEAGVVLDLAQMVPYTFASNPAKNLTLNFALVKPEGVVRINDFVPNREASARMEFEFSKDVRPAFCYSIHEQVFNAWCRDHFKW